MAAVLRRRAQPHMDNPARTRDQLKKVTRIGAVLGGPGS
jgi:hypothetical protein